MAQSPTILIVDDDEGAVLGYARILSLEGFEVRTAATAESGLREAETNPPDAIILDLHMPLIDGVEFLRRLRARREPREIAVAVVTGDYFIDDGIAAELETLGATVTYKPLWIDDIVTVAKALMRSTQ